LRTFFWAFEFQGWDDFLLLVSLMPGAAKSKIAGYGWQDIDAAERNK
jgi:hypothetical protein